MIHSTTCKKRILTTLVTILSIITICIIIQLLSVYKGNELIFPNIWDIFARTFELLGEGKTYQYIGNTLGHLVIALAISFAIGAILGLLGGNFYYVGVFLKPFMTVMRSFPIVVLTSIILLLLGIKKIPVTATVIIIIPIVYESFYNGTKNIDKTYLDVYKMHSNFNLRVAFRVHIPLIGPYIRTALVNSISMGIKVLVTTECIAGFQNTLGTSISNTNSFEVSYVGLYAYSLIIVLLILALEYIPLGIIKLFEYIKYRIR